MLNSVLTLNCRASLDLSDALLSMEVNAGIHGRKRDRDQQADHHADESEEVELVEIHGPCGCEDLAQGTRGKTSRQEGRAGVRRHLLVLVLLHLGVDVGIVGHFGRGCDAVGELH